jgi:hypothetical protein
VNRADFVAAVHELAEQLGTELWTIVEGQIERAKAQALETALEQLRAAIAGGEVAAEPTNRDVETEPSAAAGRRAPRRCSKCDDLGHDKRRCPKGEAPRVAIEPESTPAEPEPIAPPAELDQDAAVEPDEDAEHDDDPREAPSPPPTRSDRFARIEAAASARTRRAAGLDLRG